MRGVDALDVENVSKTDRKDEDNGDVLLGPNLQNSRAANPLPSIELLSSRKIKLYHLPFERMDQNEATNENRAIRFEFEVQNVLQ